MKHLPVMGSPDDTADGHALAELRWIMDSAERFATHDPDVDWPSDKHTDAVDAICAALDKVREDQRG